MRDVKLGVGVPPRTAIESEFVGGWTSEIAKACEKQGKEM